MKRVFITCYSLTITLSIFSQTTPDTIIKISHAEPLYTDLIRDLGARKGEKEINAGFEMIGVKEYFMYKGFFEYEFAPVKRWGFEVEIPFTFYHSLASPETAATIPGHKIDGIKLATQYTFLVAPKAQLSMAIGYIHQFQMNSFRDMQQGSTIFSGNLFNPFVVVAKKWRNIHTLLYTGPAIKHAFNGQNINTFYQANMSAFYVFPKLGHFIGLEVNHEFSLHQWNTVLHPQIKFKLGSNWAIGMSLGIPFGYTQSGIQFFTRLIYEPKKTVKK